MIVVPSSADAASLPIDLSGEVRLRYDHYESAGLRCDVDYGQTLVRGIIGADLHLSPNIRLRADVGTGQAWGKHGNAPPSIQNTASLQQAFVEVGQRAGSAQLSALIGRQKFAEGPRQLISVGDGANLHRSWNGIRLQAQNDRARIGAFRFKATRLKHGFLDEHADDAEELHGLYGDLTLDRTHRANSRVDAFWLHRRKTSQPPGEANGRNGTTTFGVKLSGHRAGLSYDWVLARQTGRHDAGKVSAWGFFAYQGLTLSEKRWVPRVIARLDVASGARAGSRGSRGFDQLYSSSGYLGEGRFLSLSNLLIITSGMSVLPTRSTAVTADFGLARRLTAEDAAHAGGMRAYAGTKGIGGKRIGELLRITASWQARKDFLIATDIEHFFVGRVLQGAGLSSGDYASLSATFRFGKWRS